MNNSFVHTVEFSKRMKKEEIDILKQKMQWFPEKNGYGELRTRKSVTYIEDGIQITYKACGEMERKRESKFPYRIDIKWNPSRTFRRNAYINTINSEQDMEKAIERLDEKIAEIFNDPELRITGINDLRLNRIDFTIDRRGIPVDIIRQVIDILWKMSRSRGFEENIKLLEHCRTFDRNSSYNIVNQSQDIEFVVYNKGKAAIDQKYPDQIQAYYRNTLRVELRCGRKFIRRHMKKGVSTKKGIRKLYADSEIFIRGVYSQLFKYSTHVSFTSLGVMEKILKKKFGKKIDKSRRYEKMNTLIHKMARKNAKNLEIELSELLLTESQKRKIIEYFGEWNLSPIILDDKIPFLQSLDSLLGFYYAGETEKGIKQFAERHTYGKEVFYYAE